MDHVLGTDQQQAEALAGRSGGPAAAVHVQLRRTGHLQEPTEPCSCQGLLPAQPAMPWTRGCQRTLGFTHPLHVTQINVMLKMMPQHTLCSLIQNFSSFVIFCESLLTSGPLSFHLQSRKIFYVSSEKSYKAELFDTFGYQR